MKPFDFIKPEGQAAAIDALSEHAPNVRILAGGTDYLVELKHISESPKTLIDVSQLAELRKIELVEDGLRIGSGVTHTEIMANKLIKKHVPAMIHAAHTIGAVQTRNLGTLGGNLVTCVPSMDSGPTLMALEAEVVIASADGERTMDLTQFFVGPRKTALLPSELLVYIQIPRHNLGKPTKFCKFGLRKGQALALVNAASSLWLEDGKMKDVRISLGAVAPVVIRCPQAEMILEGEAPSDEKIMEAAKVAATEARPIDDFRASKGYRNDLIKVLVTRTLKTAMENSNNS